MEFCISDINRTFTADDTSRGLYPAPDRYASYAVDSATVDSDADVARTTPSRPSTPDVPVTSIDATQAFAVVGSASGEGDTASETDDAQDADGTPARAMAVAFAVIEPNADIAEALQQLMQTLSGVARVTTMTSSADLLRSLTSDADVSAFSLSASMPDVTVPEFVFLDTGKACGDSARSDQHLRASIEELQRTLPATALVLMSVYPDRLQPDLRDMVAACIRKDTSRQELEALITRVRAERGSASGDPTRA